MKSKKPELTTKEAAFLADMRALLKRMPRKVCLGWDSFDEKLQIIKLVNPGEGTFLAEIKVRAF